jgi:hypothetical protein
VSDLFVNMYMYVANFMTGGRALGTKWAVRSCVWRARTMFRNLNVSGL